MPGKMKNGMVQPGNKLEFIDNKITKDELARRIRAFHTNDYPLKIKLHNHVFFLKEKIMTPFKKL
jgi:hypothetical protein